ncbi:hypothetical protein [Variovorax sp. SRS16]|uniref:hypothetical protein n=1 Tax=Variovorax sp. SRS16 TaxID=282217 RepID=UPI0013A52E7E|nr:hypothetical protein [Variovorax sp. SRS16]
MIIGWLNEYTKTLAAGQYYIAALMIVGAVTVIAIAIGHHNRIRAGEQPTAQGDGLIRSTNQRAL